MRNLRTMPSLAGVLACALAYAIAGCSSSDTRPSAGTSSGDPPGNTNPSGDQKPSGASAAATPAPADAPAVTLAPSGHPEIKVVVEVVQKPREIQRGMMYRQHLPTDHGMLFLMGEERVQSFWMRNTLIALDMIFINSEFEVVGVVANAEPLTDTPRGVNIPSSYVLEVNGGWAARHHVGAGTAVRFHNIEQKSPTP